MDNPELFTLKQLLLADLLAKPSLALLLATMESCLDKTIQVLLVFSTPLAHVTYQVSVSLCFILKPELFTLKLLLLA